MTFGLARDESITEAINRDEVDLMNAMKHVLFSDDLRAAILALRGERAIYFMDLLQEVRLTGLFGCYGTNHICSFWIALGHLGMQKMSSETSWRKNV
jgi:DNA-binding MurR/RpiR family transcriptional regulator